ncbi:hypothetical protein L917_04663, partial [Phytophthora nicotianae]
AARATAMLLQMAIIKTAGSTARIAGSVRLTLHILLDGHRVTKKPLLWCVPFQFSLAGITRTLSRAMLWQRLAEQWTPISSRPMTERHAESAVGWAIDSDVEEPQLIIHVPTSAWDTTISW